jgi:hypothetical protein
VISGLAWRREVLVLQRRHDAMQRAVAKLRQRGQLARDFLQEQTTVARLQERPLRAATGAPN